MATLIVLAWSKECEEDLIKKGFTKQEVYTKDVEGNAIQKRETEEINHKHFFSAKTGVRPMPYQFGALSYWGAGQN